MASFRQRGGRWQARVRRQGHPDEVRTFTSRQDAEKWARSVETEIDRGSYISSAEAQKYTFADLLGRYLSEVLRGNRHEKVQAYRYKAMARSWLGRLNLSRLTPAVVAKYRDARLSEVSVASVIRELACISSVINHGRKEWGISMANPVPLVRKPSAPRGRERVVCDEELARLATALQPLGKRSIWMWPLVLLALETAMRRGELLSLRWVDVDFAARTATLLETKNGDKRVVPLSTKALQILRDMPRDISGKVIPMTGFAVSKAWTTATCRAGLKDLHFHDLRHTAITRMAGKLPNVIELAAVSGHKSLRMLQRYYHPRAEDLAKKLG
jgi:integrase